MAETRQRDVDRRVAEWNRTGDLAALWPDVAPDALADAHARIRSVSGQILRSSLAARPDLGEPGPPAVLEAADPNEAQTLGIAGYISGMGPLIGWWAESELVATDTRTRTVFELHLDHARRRVARLHTRLREVVAALHEEGVDPIVLKGLHTGSVYFPEPGTRTGADIDLLVRPEKRSAAERGLLGAGLHESRRTAYSARSEWTLDEAGTVRSLELDHAENPWSVDLHDRLERWYFRGLRYDLGEEALQTEERASVAGIGVRVLAQPYLTAFLALHASQDVMKTRLVRLVELALVIHTDATAGRLDWHRLAHLVRPSGGLRLLHPALALTDRLVPGVVDPGFLSELNGAATRRAKRIVDAVDACALAPLPHRSLDAKFMWARGLRETLLNATELVIPSDDGMARSPVDVLKGRLDALRKGRLRWRSGPRTGGV